MSIDGYNAAWIAAARRALDRAEQAAYGLRWAEGSSRPAAHRAAMHDVRHALVMLERGPCAGSCETSCGPVYSAAKAVAAAPAVVGSKHRHFKFRYHRRKRA